MTSRSSRPPTLVCGAAPHQRRCYRRDRHHGRSCRRLQSPERHAHRPNYRRRTIHSLGHWPGHGDGETARRHWINRNPVRRQNGRPISGLTSYTQSGGSLSGSVSTIAYSLTDIAATSKGGTINASGLFDLNVALTTLPTIVEARLTGTGKLVKFGDGLVRLSNLTNDFTGAVQIDRGILSINGDALPDVAITVAEGASLQFSTNKTIDKIFLGAITPKGDLVKRSNGTLTLGGEIHLNHLGIEAGWVNIGTGTRLTSRPATLPAPHCALRPTPRWKSSRPTTWSTMPLCAQR